MTTDALPTDPVLPQLKVVWDGAAMREVFRKSLAPVGDHCFHVRDCTLSRFRHRRASRAITQYDLRLVDPVTGRERHHWVTGVVYPEDRARRIYEKLRADGLERNIPSAWLPFEPVAFVPDLKMLVQVFPFDRRLPTLPSVLAGPPLELEPRLLDGLGTGDWKIENCAVEPVRYRPLLGATIRYTISARDAATGQRGERCFYVKVYRDDEGSRTYALLRELLEKGEAEGWSFTVARPVAYLGHLRALVLEEAPGTPLERVLLDGGDAADAIRKVAQALASLHQKTVVTMRSRTRDDVVARTKRAGAYLQWACPPLSPAIERIIGAVDAGLEEVPPHPTHLDVKADHIFINGERVVFVDFDLFGAADPVLDPASLLARLDAMPSLLRIPPSRARRAAQALVEEYFAHVPSAWFKRLPLNYACAALTTALYFLQHQEPDWPEKVAAIVKRAGDAVAGRIW